jgi:hypothetical protein
MDNLVRNIVEEPLNTLLIQIKKLQKSVDDLSYNIEIIKQAQAKIIEAKKHEKICQHQMLARIQSGSLGC